MIYIRFNDVYKHCQYCKQSERLDWIQTPKGLSYIYWCNRSKCVVTAICYCTEGFVYNPEKKYPHPQPEITVGNEVRK